MVSDHAWLAVLMEQRAASLSWRTGRKARSDCRSHAARLLRSARKLDPESRYLDAASLKILSLG